MKIVLLGYGSMGKVHLNVYLRMKNVEVVGIYSTSNRGRVHDIPFVNCLDDALNLDAEAVDICLPTFLHRGAFERALAKGKHVFLEKPVAHTFEDLQAMKEAAAKSDKKVMVGQVLRYFPEYRRLRECLDPTKPTSALCSRRSKLPEGMGDWFLDCSKSGGVILDLSLHDIDYLRWVLGPVSRIYAQTDREHYYALITMRHQNGSISRIEGSWRYPGGFAQEIELAQEGQLFSYSNKQSAPLHVYTERSPESEAVELPAVALRNDPWYKELSDFITAIKENKDVPIPFEEAIESTTLALLAIESARRGQPIAVE
ncbi:Gfo/Idh/MocA family oxidoreductase [Anoxybacillus geothermalis]|nr:Gfo/Idh/MocA family oxidoreductase [Anoxybacillus geothermalis]